MANLLRTDIGGLTFFEDNRRMKNKPVAESRQVRQRLTLSKQIANAPTHAKKWEIALHGGTPPTAIQRLPDEAVGLDTPSAHGPEWQAQAIEQLTQRFTDLLLPALMADDTRPFEELIEAMRTRRKRTVSLEEFIRRQEKQREVKPSKKEIGRRLRLTLLTLAPEDLLNIRTVRAAVEKVEETFQKWHRFDFSLAPDDSKIYVVMKELNLSFLRPGDAARWIYDGKVVRQFWIQQNGKPKESGMTRKQVESLPYKTCQTNFLHGQQNVVTETKVG
jgi:hypothetical protein